MELGVMTHFGHSWNFSYFDRLAELGIKNIRDDMYWSSNEKTTGVYSWYKVYTDYMTKVAQGGYDPLIVLGYNNGLYDGGKTPYTEEARQAFANYGLALVNKFTTIKEVQVWNEYNGTTSNGTVTNDRPYYYAEMVKDVYDVLKASRPDVKIVAGSTVKIPQAYLKEMFDLGLLDHIDVLGLNTYHEGVPEGQAQELLALQATMKQISGRDIPLWSTEVGADMPDAQDAPGFLAKTMAELGAAHVERVYWYQLRDDPTGPNMGLYTNDGVAKPALGTFKLALQYFDGHTATQENLGDLQTTSFRFDNNVRVIWSADLTDITIKGNATVYDAEGRQFSELPTQVGESPLIIVGASGVSVDDGDVIADSITDYGTSHWSYFAESSSGKLAPLVLTDNTWQWNQIYTYSPTQPWLSAERWKVTPGSGRTNLVERYTATEDHKVDLDASFTLSNPTTSNGVEVWLRQNGTVFYHAFILPGSPQLDIRGLEVDLKAGDTLDMVMGGNGSSTNDTTRFRMTLTAADDPPSDLVVVSDSTANFGGAGWSYFKQVGTGALVQLTGDGSTYGDGSVTIGADSATPATSGDTPVYAIYRYTATQDGAVVVQADFDVASGSDGVDITIRHDGARVWRDVLTGSETLTGLDLDLKRGDTVDFYVGPHVTSSHDTTDIHIQILSEMATRNGTAGNDKLTGTAVGDIINGLAGNDTISGLAGNDRLFGGDGNDSLYGGDGNDQLQGDAGVDKLYGDAGNDLLWGGNDADTIYGGANDDQLWGEAGNDKLYGEAGNDILSGGDGNDVLSGGDGDDRLGGDAGADTLNGDAGADTLVGGAGADKLYGGDGDDLIQGGDDADRIEGNDGDDELYGEGANDTLYGLGGNDLLVGGDGNDIIYGGDGDDVIVVGAGYDRLYGEAGADEFQFTTTGQPRDVIYDFNAGEGDRIDISSLLANYNPDTDDIANFVKFDLKSKLTIQVSPDGNGVFQNIVNVPTVTAATVADAVHDGWLVVH